MDDAVFKNLQAGARFDQERFGDAIKLFKHGRRSQVGDVGGAARGAAVAPASSLDFFGVGAPSAPARRRRSSSAGDGQGADHPSGAGSDSDAPDTSSASSASELSGDSSDDSSGDEAAMDVFGGSAGARRNGSAKARAARKKLSKARVEEVRLEKIRAFRRQMRIKVAGADVADPVHTFGQLKTASRRTKDALLQNVEASAFKEPTPIQMQVMPCMLQGRDVLGVAPTGSGKTAAFLVPIFCRLGKASKEGARAIVLAPTRELALQIHRECDRLSVGLGLKSVVLSKANIAGAKAAALSGDASGSDADVLPCVDIIITTPLRLAGVVAANPSAVSTVQVLVLDEADRLFELGFVEQIDGILAACKGKVVQRAMFSATMPEGIEALVKSVLRDHVKVTVGVTGAGAAAIKQRLLFVGREEGKLLAMRQMITEGLKPPVLVFLQSKDRARELYDELRYEAINVDVIHAGRSKEQRDEAVKRFRTGETWVLITTDLMCRGMDFKGVNLVVNYDFPQSGISYVHRIGRTGRAGRPGEAVTFFTESDMEYLRGIANIMRISGCEVPEWMLNMKKLSHNKKKQLRKRAPRRKRISTVTKFDRQRAARKRAAVEASKKRRRGAGGDKSGSGDAGAGAGGGESAGAKASVKGKGGRSKAGAGSGTRAGAGARGGASSSSAAAKSGGGRKKKRRVGSGQA